MKYFALFMFTRLDDGCSDGVSCDYAHSLDELQEWTERRDFLRQKLAKAREDMLIMPDELDFGKYNFLLKDWISFWAISNCQSSTAKPKSTQVKISVLKFIIWWLEIWSICTCIPKHAKNMICSAMASVIKWSDERKTDILKDIVYKYTINYKVYISIYPYVQLFVCSDF